MTQETLNFISLATFNAADSGLECATIWQGALWEGGQTGGWQTRETQWVHDRLPGGIYETEKHSGFWTGATQGAYLPYATGDIQMNLRLLEMAAERTDNGFLLGRVSSGVSLALAFETYHHNGNVNFDPLVGGFASSFEWTLHNASTGAPVASGVAENTIGTGSGNPVRDVVPALPNGSHVLRTRAQGGEAFPQSLPEAIKRYGYSTTTPAPLRWRHPVYGDLYFFPRGHIGARPYDRTDPVQARLLDEELAAYAGGTSVAVFDSPSDALFYTTHFYPDGTQVPSALGEYSMLRLVAGAGAWIGDRNVHSSLFWPCLWRTPMSSELVPSGPREVIRLNPALRAVAALEVVDDELWIGGSVAGRFGPAPAFYRLQADGSPSEGGPFDEVIGDEMIGDEAAGIDTLGRFGGEAAIPTAKTVHSIARVPNRSLEGGGRARMASLYDSLLLSFGVNAEKRNAEKRLIPFHPGGRNAMCLTDINGIDHYLFSCAQYARPTPYRESQKGVFGIVVVETHNGLRAGAALAKQLDSQLATMDVFVYGVAEEAPEKEFFKWTEDERATLTQYLGRSADGLGWQPLQRWRKSDFDMGVVVREGNRKDGASLYVFGTKGEAMEPVAFRYRGGAMTQNIACEYFIQRAHSIVVNGEERILAIGLKYQSGTYPRVQHTIISAPVTLPPDTPANARDAWEAMPEGTKISLTRYTGRAAAAVWLARFVKDGEDDTPAVAREMAAYPYLWVRTDPQDWLELAEGDTVTTDVLSELEDFDQRMIEGLDRSFAVAAKERVEVCCLRPPGYRLKWMELQRRGV